MTEADGRIVEYVFDPQLFLVLLGSVLAYICIGGFAWALTPERWNDAYTHPANAKHLASIFWPVTLAGYIVYRIATFGPRTLKAWRERSKLPQAKVRQ